MSSKIQYNSLDIINILKCNKNTSLLVDKIIQKNTNEYYGIKYTTSNEAIYNGHFPDYSIMPGVIQLESALQVILVILQKKFNASNNEEIFVKKIMNVKFKKPIMPGNILISNIAILEDKLTDKDAIVAVTNYNENNEICSCAKMFFSMRNKHKMQNEENDELFNIINKKTSENQITKYNNIKEYIPHRFPFLLIDYIENINEEKNNIGNKYIINTVKNITANDPMVYSYFSENLSVLSGPLQCEIIAQAGCICKSFIHPENNKLAVFAMINNAKFYYPITIGNILKINTEISYNNKNYGRVHGTITVNDILISKHEIIFMFIEKIRSNIVNE